MIRFEIERRSFFIRASLAPAFSCLTFPLNFQRAKKNSIDLFEILIGQRVEGVRQFSNERSFALILTNDLALVFKMHGTRSNLIIFEQGHAKELFKNNLHADRALRFQDLDKTIDWSFEAFAPVHNDPGKLYFTFGKVVWQHLKKLNYDRSTIEEQWTFIQAVIAELERGDFYITDIHDTPVLSLIRTGEVRKHFKDPIESVNEYFYAFTHTHAFTLEKNSFLALLQSTLQSSKNYHQKNSAKLNELGADNNYKIWADVLMANLHLIKTGADKVTLNNFYNEDRPIEIKLKRDLSAQKNAEVFYRKSRNQKIEIAHLRQSLLKKEEEIRALEQLIDKVRQAEDLKTLRKLKGEAHTDSSANEQNILPYHEFVHEGFRIWVGRNAQSNDVLTLKFSYKEDLWLHAKDVAGSHVLIKYQSGKPFPRSVIERAAQLAAYNSKRKNESLCPVIVTPKKFVRKRKGDAPGAVVVDREDIILVEPKLT
jgi:predicted ribosome quality control (RQC) complex YloA/Tae2 family protein